MDELNVLEQAKNNLISYYDEKFEEEKGAMLRKNNERIRLIVEGDTKEQERVKKERDEIIRYNKKMNIISILIPCLIVILFIYGSLKNLEISGSFIMIFLTMFSPAIHICLRYFLTKKHKDTEDPKLSKIVNIEETKKEYLDGLNCSMNEMKGFYKTLVDYFGEEELNRKMALEMKNNEDIGSYKFILRLFKRAIEEQKEINKQSELKEKLNKVLK